MSFEQDVTARVNELVAKGENQFEDCPASYPKSLIDTATIIGNRAHKAGCTEALDELTDWLARLDEWMMPLADLGLIGEKHGLLDEEEAALPQFAFNKAYQATQPPKDWSKISPDVLAAMEEMHPGILAELIPTPTSTATSVDV